MLNNEKNKNKNSKEINETLTNKINSLEKKCFELKNQIIINNNDSINKLNRTIDEYKDKLSRYPFELLKNEKIVSVIFISEDESFYYSILCKNTDIFNIIEERLYKVYPELSGSDNNFVANGKIVNKYQTLEQNNIKNNNIIILNQKQH